MRLAACVSPLTSATVMKTRRLSIASPVIRSHATSIRPLTARIRRSTSYAGSLSIPSVQRPW